MKRLNKVLGNINICFVIIISQLISILLLGVAITIYLFQKPIPQNDYLKVAVIASVAFVLGTMVTYIVKKGFIKSGRNDLDKAALALSLLGTSSTFAISLSLYLCYFVIF